MSKSRKGVLLASFLAFGCGMLRAADCAALKSINLHQATITTAEMITGDLTVAGEPPMHELPQFCRVAGILRPSGDSEIRFEVWMPADGWNGRLLGVGNGGFAGSIGYRQFVGYLKRGYAVAGSDAGHQGESTDGTFAYGHPEKVKDFGWRAVHVTTEGAKQIVAAYYGKQESKAYFDACSDGGREALMEAERFPDDYDGILAGAPANAWSTMLAAGIGAMQNLMSDPRSYIPPRKLDAIQKAALDACDKLDGVGDGVIGDPTQCKFDPQVLLCNGAETRECLTQPQINTVKALYSGAKDKTGATIFPGFSMGDETGWGLWVVGDSPGASLFSQFVQNDFRYLVTGDPKWNVLAADQDAMLKLSREKTAADLDSTNPDLGKFAAHGGKLILYHGWNDAAISPWNTIAYYRSVQQTMGVDKTATFVELFMVPGMEHCLGGPGASTFGQFGLATDKGPKYGVFDALVDWVEKGAPDDNIVATKYSQEMKPQLTRPLCAYPKVAKYNGTGDTNDAGNYTCATQ